MSALLELVNQFAIAAQSPFGNAMPTDKTHGGCVMAFVWNVRNEPAPRLALLRRPSGWKKL